VEVIDEVLKHDLPQGPCWRRYNHDGYGEKPDGSAYDGTGEGRCWPILTGERGHYELALGRDPLEYIETIEKFANVGGMLPEQIWDADDLPDGKMKWGEPTGSAMPLCWSHAEYLSLVRSRMDGVCFDRIEPAYERYAIGETSSETEMWTVAHQLPQIAPGKGLRIITADAAVVLWSVDDWKTIDALEMTDTAIGCWFADLPTDKLPESSRIVFTLQWTDRWEGRNFEVEVTGSIQTEGPE